MHRLGHQNTRIVLVQLQQQRRAVSHHWNKLLVAHPCRVKQDVITQVANVVHHLTGVINGAIVSTQLDHCQSERALVTGATRGNFGDQLAKIAFFEAVRVNATNKTVRVTCCFQINRRRTGL